MDNKFTKKKLKPKTRILEVKNLKVILNQERIIDNLSFSIDEGEILTILGPNGSGKSVLVKTLLDIFPCEGQIIWHKKPKIGYLPQNLSQLAFKNYPVTVLDFFRLKDPKLTQNQIIKYLKLVKVNKNILEKTLGTLSGGQFQRILIAWVLITKPKLVFLMNQPQALIFQKRIPSTRFLKK